MEENKTYKVCKECYKGFNKIIEQMSKNFEKKINSLKKINFNYKKMYPSLESTHVNSSLSLKSFSLVLTNFFKNLNDDVNSGLFGNVKKKINNTFLKLKKENKLSMKKILTILVIKKNNDKFIYKKKKKKIFLLKKEK